MKIRMGVLELMVAIIGVGGLAGCRSGQPAAAGEAQGKRQTLEPAKSVTFKTSDGWTIAGDLYEALGKSQGAVILLHQRGGQSKDWVPLCYALQESHLTALAIDQRGAGRSTKGPGGTGDDAPWSTSPDIEAAIKQVQGKGSVGLVGASYGANNALIYAAAHPQQVKSIVLFSPGANYHGLDALAPARKYKGAVLIFHNKKDEIAGAGPGKIYALLPARDHSLSLSNGSEHGTALLNMSHMHDTASFFQRTLK